MDFQEKMENKIHEMKKWMHHHLPKHHHYGNNCCGMHKELVHFENNLHWTYVTKFLPQEINDEIHRIYLTEHEKYLNDYFKSAKKMKVLEHKMEVLQLDIAEHWHVKKNEFDKKVISESLDELKKVKHELTDLVNKEKDVFKKAQKSAEDKVYSKIQEFLKK